MRVSSAHTRDAAGPGGRLASAATTATLLLAACAVLSLVAKLFFENRWASLTCGDSHTQVLDRLVPAAGASAILAVVVGIAALSGHTQHKGWVVLGMLVAGAIVALILVPDAFGGYSCGILTA